MNFRHLLPISICFFLFLSCDIFLVQKQERIKRPNIIFILSDDQAWGDYSFMGHPHIQTPYIDQLAKESATYTRGYVSSPLCGPSLATIITGKYAFQHGQTGNDAGDSKREERLWGKEPKKGAKRNTSGNYLFSKERNDQFDVIKAKFYKHQLLTD